jgi:hypothetical protein
MKAFLMYPDRDFYLGQELPPNETDLADRGRRPALVQRIVRLHQRA